jgi:hypothetical protein
MANNKSVLHSFQTITAGDMSQSSITSKVTNILNLDNVGIQLNWSGAPVGTFAIQVSMDYQQDAQGNVTKAGNWVSIALSPALAAAGSGDSAYADLAGLSAPWIRVVYTKTSGTGTLNAFISGKRI